MIEIFIIRKNNVLKFLDIYIIQRTPLSYLLIIECFFQMQNHPLLFSYE